MPQVFLALASAMGLLAVGLGAFGAHALKSRLSDDMLAVWQTAVQYHFYHTLALLAVAILLRQFSTFWLNIGGYAFIAGLALFCGSLYWLALGGPRWLGPITPLGGLCFMLGWIFIGIGALR